MERRSRTALGAGASSCDDLTEIVSSADQRPFIGHFVDAAQKKLSKASRLFDLAEDRFDDLLAQSVAATVASAPFGSHRLHERTTLWFPHDDRPDARRGQWPDRREYSVLSGETPVVSAALSLPKSSPSRMSRCSPAHIVETN